MGGIAALITSDTRKLGRAPRSAYSPRQPATSNLKRLLGIAAMVAIRNKNSYLGVYFRRLAARRGGKRALVAVIHKLAIAI
ncbi:hypothetical protein ABZ864_24580 [Streptomyces sp. NPDC047082]|uniref:hypothetical protein n=1 Tax=Streptomyces sp. NPDC047082 TaxID=3155259 RepID=UPI0033F37C7A